MKDHWTKGREQYFYWDKDKSHRFRVFAQSETDAKSCINNMLEIVDDQPLNDEYLVKSTVDRNWNEIDYIRVAGDSYQKPKMRPTGEVYFSHAWMRVTRYSPPN